MPQYEMGHTVPTSSMVRRNICNCIFSFTKITVTLFFFESKTSEKYKNQEDLGEKNSPWVDRPHDKMLLYEHFSILFYAMYVFGCHCPQSSQTTI